MTRAFANKVSKECLRQSVTTSLNGDRRSILTHERVVCGGLRHATGTRLMVWALLAKGTYALWAPTRSPSAL